MNEQPQPTAHTEDKLSSVGSDLEYIFIRLNLVLDVCIVCHKALVLQNAAQDDSVANILQRCGGDILHEQLEELTKVVEQLGGTTDYSSQEQIDEQTAAVLNGEVSQHE